jgi:hypothetical protein
MVVLAGNTAHFAVYYDETLPNGLALANAIRGGCEADLNTLAGIWVGTPTTLHWVELPASTGVRSCS